MSDAAPDVELARRAAREVTLLLGADTSVYFLIDEGYEYAIAFAAYHLPAELRRPELARIRIGDLPVFIGAAIERGAAAASSDEPAQDLADHPFIRGLPLRPQSILYAPAIEQSRLSGALVSYWWHEPHVVTERETRLATEVARRAAMALAGSSELRYRGLFERSLAGMFRTRRDGRITDCNPAFARMLGYASPADLIGRHASEFCPTAADHERILAEVHRTGTAANLEVELVRRDGSAIPVLMNLMVSAGGPEPVYEGQILDVSDREAAEAARREAAALRSVASLANGAAHSINNPLTVLRGTLELLLHRPEEKVTMQRLAPALRAIEQIADVVRRMSQITRLELMRDAPGDMRMLDLQQSGSDAPTSPAGGAAPTGEPPRAAPPA